MVAAVDHQVLVLVLGRPRRVPIEGFPALVAHLDFLGTNFAEIGVATGQDHRLAFFEVELLVANHAMQFHCICTRGVVLYSDAVVLLLQKTNAAIGFGLLSVQSSLCEAPQFCQLCSGVLFRSIVLLAID